MTPYEQRQPHPAAPDEIARWLPNTWDEVAGNDEVKKVLIDCIRADGRGPNLLLQGPSRSGKTACIKLYLATLACLNRRKTLDPCGQCANCTDEVRRNGQSGMFSDFSGSRVHIYLCDCTQGYTEEIKTVLEDMYFHSGDRFIIYLDEVHRLARHGTEEKLLIPAERLMAQFVASAIDTDKLESAFLNRFFELKTCLPAPDEVARFIDQRCVNWMIEIDPSDDRRNLVSQIADSSLGNIGKIILLFSRAALSSDRRITRDMIRRFTWDR